MLLGNPTAPSTQVQTLLEQWQEALTLVRYTLDSINHPSCSVPAGAQQFQTNGVNVEAWTVRPKCVESGGTTPISLGRKGAHTHYSLLLTSTPQSLVNLFKKAITTGARFTPL
jgi:hypothetical protein